MPKVLRRFLMLSPAMLMIGLFMLIPILIIVAYSFMDANPYGGVRAKFSTEAYVQLVFERDFDDTLLFNKSNLLIFGRSISLALASTLLSLLIAFPVAYYMSRQEGQRKHILVLLVTIPFWTNLLIRTFCWILILRDTGLINNFLLAIKVIDSPLPLLNNNGAVLLGLIYSYIPFMILPIYATLEKLDTRLLEAAHDLYANRWQVLRLISIPLALPGIIAGCILVFIPSLGAFVTPQLLGGGKNLMLGSLIQLQFSSSRNWPFGAALALLLLALVMLALIFYARGPARRSEGGLL
ncbi:MAG: ABC transporter permease [Deinococcales bacterium]